MRKLILLAVCAIVFIGVQFLVNCSDPLENGSLAPVPPAEPEVDTIYRFDTVVVMVFDSVFHVDSLIRIDSIFHVDTVFIVDNDTIESSRMVCARLASSQQEIVWMFRNPDGVYRLEFSASTESGRPTQTLSVNIDGQLFEWSPGKNAEFIIALHLRPNAIVRITSNNPGAFGHAIDVCLTMSKL